MNSKSNSHSKKPPGRAWWQWVMGLGLLVIAACFTVLRLIPGLSPTPFELVEIRVSPELEQSEVVPAKPGSLADRNLLVVTFDTTRADRIGCYGNDKIRTYTMDRLAAEGVLFSQAIAPAPTTLPSHSSLMTGLYPYHHGARANGLYRLDSKYLTLAEILTDNGYATGAAVSASVLEKQYGIAQGFQDFDDQTESKDETGGLAALTVAERTGDQTAERAEQWIRAHAADKFFYWVHFYDPHFPYQAPSPYSEKYADPYDAEIAFTDAQLARLIELLDELDLSDSTLIVVAGDHGEARGQHQEPTHSCLVYDSTLHVPMVMRCGDQLGGGVHVRRPVSLVDIMPTVLTLLGIETPAQIDGIDLTRPPAGDRSLYFETLQGLADFGWAALLGVRNESWKYIYGPTSELYDVSTDPFETTDLIDARPEIAATMHKRLEDFFGSDLEQAASAEPTHRLDAAELAKLQSLGYLQDVGAETPPPSERRHPKEIVALLAPLYRAVADQETKGIEATIKQLEGIVERHPDLYQGHIFLGNAYLKNGDKQRAEAEYLRCMELRPNRSEPALALARIMLEQKRQDEAIRIYTEALTKNPNDFPVLKQLGLLLFARGEFRPALDVMTQALTLWPRDEHLPDSIAHVALAVGSGDDTIKQLQDLLEVSPDLPKVRNALSQLLMGKKEYDEAVATLREGVKLSPERRDLINNLAFLLISNPDPSKNLPIEAAVMLERICYETGYGDPRYLHTLSLAYSVVGRMEEAISVASKAHQIAARSEKPEFSQLLPSIGLSLERYKMLKERGISPTSGPRRDESGGAATGPKTSASPQATDPVPDQDAPVDEPAETEQEEQPSTDGSDLDERSVSSTAWVRRVGRRCGSIFRSPIRKNSVRRS